MTQGFKIGGAARRRACTITEYLKEEFTKLFTTQAVCPVPAPTPYCVSSILQLSPVQGVPKKCHDFNLMPFPQLLTKTIVLCTCYFQHLSMLFDNNSSQTLQWISHQRKEEKLSHFDTKRNCSHNLVNSAANVAWNIMIFHGAFLF